MKVCFTFVFGLVLWLLVRIWIDLYFWYPPDWEHAAGRCSLREGFRPEKNQPSWNYCVVFSVFSALFSGSRTMKDRVSMRNTCCTRHRPAVKLLRLLASIRKDEIGCSEHFLYYYWSDLMFNELHELVLSGGEDLGIGSMKKLGNLTKDNYLAILFWNWTNRCMLKAPEHCKFPLWYHKTCRWRFVLLSYLVWCSDCWFGFE